MNFDHSQKKFRAIFRTFVFQAVIVQTLVCPFNILLNSLPFLYNRAQNYFHFNVVSLRLIIGIQENFSHSNVKNGLNKYSTVFFPISL